MLSNYKQITKFFVFFTITVFLFWLIYRDQDLSDLLVILREDVNYFWVGVAVFLGMLSHVSRALRWQLLTRSMGYPISFMNSFMGVMIGYFANLAFPRMGEFTRCGVVNKYEQVPFSKLLGTVVTERIFDMLMLLLMTLFVVITQFKQVLVFFAENQDIRSKLLHVLSSGWILGGVLLLCGLTFLVIWLWRKQVFAHRIRKFLSGLKEGLFAVRGVSNKRLFVGHTLFIWLMYFLMLYVCFFCFEFTSQLGGLVGLTVFVISCYGMVAPVQGGVGAWHFMVIAALLLYLPHTPEIESLAKTFALLAHGTMTLLYIVIGVFCLLYLPIYNRNK